MYYNKWELKQERFGKKKGQFIMALDETDDQPREDKEEKDIIPSGTMGGAWIYFPRKDEAQNQKYKQILIDYVEKKLLDNIDALKKDLDNLNRFSSKLKSVEWQKKED